MTSDAFKADAYAQETGTAFLLLVTINHDALSTPIRVALNDVQIISRGETFLPVFFEIELPNLDSDEPVSRIRIDNVDREIVASVRAIRTAATVTTELIRHVDPDDVEIEFPDFFLRDVGYDALVVEGKLTIDGLFQEPFPAESMTPSLYPGVF